MGRIFSQADISRVQQAADIVEVVSEHLSLTKKGREMVGLCPFHEDHRPSLYVNPTKQIFKCFACGAGGDVFKFLQMRENLTFAQAVERLAQRYSIDITPVKTSQRSETSDDVNPNELARVNTWADKFFSKSLSEKGSNVKKYLKQRGIMDESINTWHLGFAPAGGTELVDAARKRDIDEKLLTASGLAVRQGGSLTDKFVNRLMFTITDVTGRAIGFGGRMLEGVGAKYINSPATALFDKSNCLYGLQQARHEIGTTGTAVVVEGYTDVIMAHQFGFNNVVATLGTSLTEGHARILKRYAKTIILIFDSDTAGVEAANRALELCLAQQIDIKVASVEQGKDPCEFLMSRGADAFGDVLSKAVDVFDFKWNRLQETFDRDNTFTGRKAAVNEFIQSVATAMSSGKIGPIERGLIVNRLAAIVGTEPASVNTQLNRRLRALRRTAGYRVKNDNVVALDFGHGLFAAAQREIIEILLNRPDLFEQIRGEIRTEDFSVPLLHQSAEVIFDVLGRNGKADLNEILASVEQTELASAVISMYQAGREKSNFNKRLKDAVEVFQKCLGGDKEAQSGNIDIDSLARRYRKGNPHSLGMFNR